MATVKIDPEILSNLGGFSLSNLWLTSGNNELVYRAFIFGGWTPPKNHLVGIYPTSICTLVVTLLYEAITERIFVGTLLWYQSIFELNEGNSKYDYSKTHLFCGVSADFVRFLGCNIFIFIFVQNIQTWPNTISQKQYSWLVCVTFNLKGSTY